MMNTQENILLQTAGDSKSTIVKRFGSSISTLLLDMECTFFNTPGVVGAIGYLNCGNSALVIGDPMCLIEDRNSLVEKFHLYCRKNNKKIIYFMATAAFAHWAIKQKCSSLIEVGEELAVDPMSYQKRQKIRWKINQSISHGVKIKEHLDNNIIPKEKLNDFIKTWLAHKRGPQIFLGKLDISIITHRKRVFYAEKDGAVVGFIALSYIDRNEGWVVNYFFSLEAPVGISEHLLDAVLRSLANESCNYLCLGIVAGSQLGAITGINYFLQFMARFLFKISKKMFNLDARKIFMNKFHPHTSPTFILTSERLTLREMLSIRKALSIEL